MRKNLLLLFFLQFLFSTLSAENDSLSYYYAWLCGDQVRECSLDIDDALLDYYRTERDHLAYRYSSFNSNDSEAPANFFGFMFSKPEEEVIRNLVVQLVDDTMSVKEKIMSALTFVQALPYSKDGFSKGKEEYVRYPVETLADGTGDCEDKALLLGAILYELGLDFVLLLPPDHMALGVCCEGVEADRYFLFHEKKYYYLETTNPRWEIGQIPEEYHSSKFEIHPLKIIPTLIVKGVQFESSPARPYEKAVCQLQLQLLNAGPGKITDLQLETWLVGKKLRSGESVTEAVFQLDDLEEGATKDYKVEFKSLISKNAVLQMRITGNGIPDQALELKLK